MPNNDHEKKGNKKDTKSLNSTSSLSLNDSQKIEVDSTDPLAQHTGDLGLLHANSIYEETAASLDNLLQTCLDRDMTSENLSLIFKYLEPWITSLNDHERLRCMRTLSRLLKHFAENYRIILGNVRIELITLKI